MCLVWLILLILLLLLLPLLGFFLGLSSLFLSSPGWNGGRRCVFPDDGFCAAGCCA